MVSSSRGCLFCWWLKPLADGRKATWLFEMLESVSCAIRASPLLRPQWSSSVLPMTWTDPTNNHAIWSYGQICWISFAAACFTHFHQEPPSATTVLSPVATEQLHWRKCTVIIESEKTEADWLNIIEFQVCFAFPGHSFTIVHRSCWSHLWQLQSYNQFNVNCGQVGESSPSFMCTKATLIF